MKIARATTEAFVTNALTAEIPVTG